MTRACVIGWPIAHSRSPLIHGHWLARYGIAGTYSKEAVTAADLPAFLETLKQRGFAGCNVTVPHKEAAYMLAAERTAEAQAIGAANTLWLEDGVLHATNTDTYGYMAHLNASAPGWHLRDAPVGVLGAGGAARAIVYGFLQAGVSEVRIFNRSRDRAEALARDLGTRVRVCDWAHRSALSQGACVLVNTTSLGLKDQGETGVDFAGFHSECVVSDIVYVPLETRLLAQARSRGLKTVDGLGMLLHQAVPGFALWFGRTPEVTAELRTLIVHDIETS
jgi:shikimate dehydrogenase